MTCSADRCSFADLRKPDRSGISPSWMIRNHSRVQYAGWETRFITIRFSSGVQSVCYGGCGTKMLVPARKSRLCVVHPGPFGFLV
ncbi:hypothetical protein AVEN_79489-1 [Araneus ventricosus]|uniref:Uncharacterized protein n=1 Tax=Araneus ventricosus TaxID=182803 RepID=A0A4Y2S3Z5_ARAVE|nr:hypothetical protein AVEN_79489-1 [Araneus ventricosus]